MTDHSKRKANSLAFGRSLDAERLVRKIANMSAMPNPARAKMQLVYLIEEAKQIMARSRGEPKEPLPGLEGVV